MNRSLAIIKILALAIIPLFATSCSKYMVKDIYGTYHSVGTMKDGRCFQLQINSDGSFIEENYYCTIYGRCYVEKASFDLFYRMAGEKRLVLKTDSIVSNKQLHYDGVEKNNAFKESLYCYSFSDTAIVELCDRTGERIPIHYLSFADAQEQTIFEYDNEEESTTLTSCIIPSGTSSIFLFQDRNAITSGECKHYSCDSGSVCFIVLPHVNNNNRIVFVKRRVSEIIYLPYDTMEFPNPLSLRRGKRHVALRLVRRTNLNSPDETIFPKF